MIRYLQGKIILKKEKFIVIDVNGVGYKVFVSKKTLSNISKVSQNFALAKERKSKEKIQEGEISEMVSIFCFLKVGENTLDLYGFLDEKELEFFEILENIRGVGPKASLEISSLGPLEKIKERILSQDRKLFEEIPGIGRKKAMTIVLELTGKIKDISKKDALLKKPRIDEAEESLVNLGFSRQRAREALLKISGETVGVDQKVKEALKILGK